MRPVCLLALLAAGCRFEVPSLEVDEGVVVDGGDDALDANVELGFQPPDANLFDFSLGADLARPAPDGAAPRQPGFPCDRAAACDSGFCVDGYCCDVACDPADSANRCSACNIAGSEGHCSFALDGTDPRNLCDQSVVSTCGQDGQCDGKGSCRRYGAGTLCGAASCANGTLSAPPSCDGNGRCVAGSGTVSCAPYDCASSGGGCATTCTASGGCAQGATCNASGQCDGKSGLGGGCASGGDCQSGYCSQKVCCESDCSGTCRSCNQTGAAGFCLFVAAGQDPLDQCTASTRTSCGLDGACDGMGGCRNWQAGTPCAGRVCNGDFTVAPRFCSGSGSCLLGTATSCMPYTCNAASGVCFGQPCSSDGQCSGKNKCKKGQCG
jgi:hypothetical protein